MFEQKMHTETSDRAKWKCLPYSNRHKFPTLGTGAPLKTYMKGHSDQPDLCNNFQSLYYCNLPLFKSEKFSGTVQMHVGSFAVCCSHHPRNCVSLKYRLSLMYCSGLKAAGIVHALDRLTSEPFPLSEICKKLVWKSLTITSSASSLNFLSSCCVPYKLW